MLKIEHLCYAGVMKKYWLIKSEGDCYSIDDLKKDQTTAWSGIRNYQARNYMMNGMDVGDLLLFYHSGGVLPGVAGIAKVVSEPHPDMTAFDKKDMHYEPKATKEKPIWHCIDVAFVKKLKNFVGLPLIKNNPKLKGMMVAQIGSRLSVQPVSEVHFNEVIRMGS